MKAIDLFRELKKRIRAGRLGRIEKQLENHTILLNSLIQEGRNNQMTNKELLAEIGTALEAGLEATQASLQKITTSTEDIAGDVLELKTKLDAASDSNGLTAEEAQQAVTVAGNLLAKANALKLGAQAASDALKSAADILPEVPEEPIDPEEPEEPVTV